ISLFEFMAVRKSHVAALLSLPCILAGDAGLAGKYADALQKAFGSLKPADIPMRQIVDNETRIMGWSAHKQVEVVFDDLRARAPAALPEIVMDLMRVSFRRGPDVLQTKLYWLM